MVRLFYQELSTGQRQREFQPATSCLVPVNTTFTDLQEVDLPPLTRLEQTRAGLWRQQRQADHLSDENKFF